MVANVETAKMLIKFYNMQAGTSFKSSNESNQETIDMCLQFCDNDVVMLKDHIRSWVNEHREEAVTKDGFDECMWAFRSMVRETKPTEATTQSGAVANTEVQYGMDILGKAVVGLIANTQADKIEAEIMDQLEQRFRDFVKEEIGTVERKIVTVVDGKKAELKGVLHEQFDTVLKFVSRNRPVFLYGPAGSGKNYLCKQVAEALGLKFYFTNAVTQEYKLTGYTDAMGTYQPSQFYKAFTEGGVFFLDEMDASIPEVLLILNAAIANRYFDFPAPIGYKEAHKDFRIIAAGNTVGQGASSQYTGRNQLDASSLDRFAYVEINYSEQIENDNALGDIELANFCRDYRKSALKGGLQIVVSYRAISMIAEMSQIMTLEETLKTCLVKGTEKDDLNIICNGIQRDSKFKTALRNVINSMAA